MNIENHRGLLSTIEVSLREAEQLKLACSESKKRIKRLKSEKFVEPASKELKEMEQRVIALELKVDTDTITLFKEVCGITKGGVARLLDSEGVEQGKVLVDMIRARQLDNGSAVLTVGGTRVDPGTDSSEDTTFGTYDLLVAVESEGQVFKAAE